MVDDIETTLKERAQRYGDFPTHATITQNIKRALRLSPNWHNMSDDKQECLEMVAHKIGRILNGDPEYHDSWLDIAGYAKLVADEILRTESEETMAPHRCHVEKSWTQVKKGEQCNWCARVVQ